MDGFSFVDIYSTKGIEYLIAVVFFFGFLALQWYMMTPAPGRGKARSVPTDVVDWFRVPDGYNFHQGHSWMKFDIMRPDREPLVRVGMDDFAQKFVGKVDSVVLPPVGTRLVQGDKGWVLRVGSREIPMLSPVDGKIVAVNENAMKDPGVVNEDPFGKGWLLKIAPDRLAANRAGLLTGNLARRWTEEALHGLRLTMGGNLGPVYQDGGLPVSGIAKAIYGEDWDKEVREHFLTGGAG